MMQRQRVRASTYGLWEGLILATVGSVLWLLDSWRELGSALFGFGMGYMCYALLRQDLREEWLRDVDQAHADLMQEIKALRDELSRDLQFERQTHTHEIDDLRREIDDLREDLMRAQDPWRYPAN